MNTGPMDLRELLEAPPYDGGRTRMDVVLDLVRRESGAGTVELLMDRLRDPAITTAWIVKVLRQAGYVVGETSVNRYRRQLKEK